MKLKKQNQKNFIDKTKLKKLNKKNNKINPVLQT